MYQTSIDRKLVSGWQSSACTSWLCWAQCLGPTYTGDFHLRGADLRKRGLNRVGNLLVPNSNYCAFEDWIMPILDAMKREQDDEGARWTPSKVTYGLIKCTSGVLPALRLHGNGCLVCSSVHVPIRHGQPCRALRHVTRARLS